MEVLPVQFHNKVALVTGGGGGIGRVTAVALAEAGAQVVVADVAVQAGEETARLIEDRGGRSLFIQTDVTQADQVQRMIDQTVAHFGRLDCAFNNAGIEGTLARTADIAEAEFDQLLAVNLKGVWLCMKAEIQQMLRQGGGAIVNTASVAGVVGAHSMPIYSATKHGVVGLTRSAAVEYTRSNIRVNAIAPSFTRTPMAERAFAQFPRFEEAVIRSNPSRRLAEAEEVAAAVLWLFSDAASFVTGMVMPVDGGFTAQ
jgi:NAD(P)-dependent dehydrogenase (short-subunit alcohol dehydrogenase family)